MTRIAVVSVHPDDETLGCGGTILRHVAAGDEVSWVIATAAWEPRFSKATIEAKATEVARVADAYGFTSVVRLGLPTTRLRDLPLGDIVTPLEHAMDMLNPEWLYTIHAGDVHTDHRAVFDALSVIFKPFRAGAGLQRFLSFETLSSTDAAPPDRARAFIPTMYVDISRHLERKLAIMEMFETEKQDPPLPRSIDAIRALARVRGATIGRQYAEAFMIVREIARDPS